MESQQEGVESQQEAVSQYDVSGLAPFHDGDAVRKRLVAVGVPQESAKYEEVKTSSCPWSASCCHFQCST